MIARSSLPPSASLFSNHGVCLFCQKSLHVRRYAWRAPSTIARQVESVAERKGRSAEEIVARQLGKPYVAKEKSSVPGMPAEIFMQAHKARRLRIQPHIAQQIVRIFEPMINKPSAASTLVSLCSTHNVDLDHLTGLGALLLQSKNPAERLLGRNILLSASRAGSPSATIFLVNSARKQGSLSATELVKPKAHLQELVKSDPTNVQALVLQGLLYKNQGSNSMAASLFKQVIAQRSKNMTPDEKPLKKFLRGFGFNFENSDPNLDPRRPEDLELDVVQAHIQLSILQYPKNKEAALENLKMAALTYDDPIAYFLLARAASTYSLEWLEHTRKAAASGHTSAMEDMGEIHSWSEELLNENIEDERVRDWILNNPLFNAPSQGISLTSLSKAQRNIMRTVKRYEWAKGWYGAAGRQAHDRQNLANYEITRIDLAIIDLMESIGQSPSWWIRYERVLSLKNLRHLQTTDGIDATLKSQVQLAVRKLVQDQMGQETKALENFWDKQGKKLASNSDWLREFLKSIDDVPLGKWRSDT